MRRAYAVTAALLVTLTACAGDPVGPSTSASGTPRGSASPSPTDDTSDPTPNPSESVSGGGTADAPEVVTPGTELLDWTSVPGPVESTVTVSGDWTLTVPADRSRAVLAGPSPLTVPAGRRATISDTFLDESYALVVSQDRLEERPSTATVTELATGRTLTIDGDSDVPTVSGGTWALGGGTAVHATYDADGAYCVASVNLETGTSQVPWCAPPRSGFSNARLTDLGDLTLLTFDDSRPSCRTVAFLGGAGELTPFDGVPECKGWEGISLPGGGRVWTVIPDEKRIENARVYAAADGGYYDLGPATSGSLIRCDGAAYFSRDPGREGEPARVLRWSEDLSLDVVYEAPAAKDGFLAGPPRCGGHDLTVTALTAAGDEQVTARLG